MSVFSILAGQASGQVLATDEGLSFWGGVDPLTGLVIDAHHPLSGQSLAGKACDFFWITNCLPLDGVIRSDNRGSESFFPLWLIGKNDEPARANFSPQVLAETSASPETLLQYLYALWYCFCGQLCHSC